MTLHRLDRPAFLSGQFGNLTSRILECVSHESVNPVVMAEIIHTTDARQGTHTGGHVAVCTKFHRIAHPLTHLSAEAIECIVRHYAATINDDGPLAQRLYLREYVGRQDDCAILSQPLNECPNTNQLFGIETAGGLV